MGDVKRARVDPIAEARRQWDAHGWTDAAAGMTAVTSIMRAHQLLLARVDEALRPFALTFARYELLTLLSFTREGRMPMASASARLQVHPTSVTNTVDRLEASGHVRRAAAPWRRPRDPHRADRRRTRARRCRDGGAQRRRLRAAGTQRQRRRRPHRDHRAPARRRGRPDRTGLIRRGDRAPAPVSARGRTSTAQPSSSRPMMTRMISFVPSRIWCTRRSRTTFSMPYSCRYP